MRIQATVDEVTRLADGVWKGNLTPGEVRSLGNSSVNLGATSVVATRDGAFEDQGDSLSFDPSDAVVLNVGTGNSVIFLSLGVMESSTGTIRGTSSKDEVGLRGGDRLFLDAARLLLTPELAQTGEELLREIRSQQPGELKEGQARKWVNEPDNFVAITIQPRDQSYAIHVRGDPKDFGSSSLDIRQDRTSYCRFKIKTRDQVVEAIYVIMHSIEIYGT